MPNSPKISIITICYNAEDYIKPTLESVANQSFRDIEHVIIDGNSKDKTLDIINSFPNIKNIISERDNGLYDAMNKGIDKSNGEYICFMNGGDLFYTNNTLEEVFSISKDEDFIYGDVEVFDNKGNTRGYHKITPKDSDISYKSFKNGMVICHQSMIVKRKLAEKFRDDKFKISADIDWSIRTLKNCKSFKDVGFPISRFLDGGVSQTNRWDSVKERFWISVEHFGIVPTIVTQFKLIFRYFISK